MARIVYWKRGSLAEPLLGIQWSSFSPSSSEYLRGSQYTRTVHLCSLVHTGVGVNTDGMIS